MYPVATTLKKMSPLSHFLSRLLTACRSSERLGSQSLSSIHDKMLTSPVFCSCCAGNHSCCEFKISSHADVLNFMQSHLLIPCSISSAIGTLFRKSLPMPVSSSVYSWCSPFRSKIKVFDSFLFQYRVRYMEITFIFVISSSIVLL